MLYIFGRWFAHIMFGVLFATVRFVRPSAACPWIWYSPATVADLYLTLSLLRPLSFFPPYFPASHYRWWSSTQRLVNRLAALEQMFRRQSLRMYVRTYVCVFMWNWAGLEKWKTTTYNHWAHRLGWWISDLCIGTEEWTIEGFPGKTGSRFWDWGGSRGLKQLRLVRGKGIFSCGHEGGMSIHKPGRGRKKWDKWL